jgi:hypothetical protein
MKLPIVVKTFVIGATSNPTNAASMAPTANTDSKTIVVLLQGREPSTNPIQDPMLKVQHIHDPESQRRPSREQE